MNILRGEPTPHSLAKAAWRGSSDMPAARTAIYRIESDTAVAASASRAKTVMQNP